jgi:hypothetical protein
LNAAVLDYELIGFKGVIRVFDEKPMTPALRAVSFGHNVSWLLGFYGCLEPTEETIAMCQDNTLVRFDNTEKRPIYSRAMARVFCQQGTGSSNC